MLRWWWIMIKQIIKNALKAVCAWLICLLSYFVFILWTHIQIPFLTAIFGINISQSFVNGSSVTMSGNYPIFYISLGVFVAVWVMITYIDHKLRG